MNKYPLPLYSCYSLLLHLPCTADMAPFALNSHSKIKVAITSDDEGGYRYSMDEYDTFPELVDVDENDGYLELVDVDEVDVEYVNIEDWATNDAELDVASKLFRYLTHRS